MNNTELNLDFAEQAVFALRSLYNRFGYIQYKMSKFEEYDLYARNKDFLISDSVITFTDLNGKLMALKPDVTLSIVKNTADRPDSLQKLYYNENVYRVSKSSRSFKEITQVGLETFGAIDSYCISEVLLLAAESLLAISPEAILDVSHLGLLSELLGNLGIPQPETGRILGYIGEKNLHELSATCASYGIPKENVDVLVKLTSLSGVAGEVLPQAEALLRGRVNDDTLEDFLRILSSLSDSDAGPMLHLDFSVVDDIHYYNGIVFKGFIHGLPAAILSGGQYDKLMQKMGRSDSAIGFAVYMDMTERLAKPVSTYDVDTVLLYNENADLSVLRRQTAALSAEGSVLALRNVPETLKYRRLMKLQGSEVAELENNT